MKKIKLSILFNTLIFLLALFGTISMLTGFEFMGHSELLTAGRTEAFKFFTVDSNVLVGICSLILVIFEVRYLQTGKEIPKYVYLLKYIGTCSVLLTFIVTIGFLAPFAGLPFFEFYKNSNLFFHFVVPLLSVFSFGILEGGKIKVRDTIYGMIPMFTYSIFYMSIVLPHIENGVVSPEYDFYGFLKHGFNSIFYVIPIIFVVTYGIGYALYLFQKKIGECDESN